MKAIKKPEIVLSPKDEKYLYKKFGKYAKALQWVGADTTYYIHVGSEILKSKDTADLYNQLKKKFVENEFVEIW